MKIWVFALALSFLSLIASLVLEPANREGAAQQSTARMEFNGYIIYDIGVLGVSGVLTAQSGRVFADREELDYPVALRETNGSFDGLSGVLGVVKGDNILIKNKVYYWDDAGRTLKTQSAKYDKKSQIIIGEGAFTLTSDQGVMQGVGFSADSSNKIFTASKIKAILNDTNM
ncbi:MAG: LPS export ABC transporter periplasmic protein LptC [Helicobacteraceae bacterium]|nr:LPS export ABC transporter periplasmic protein LptC [Helicobacteraceae bacterium]